MGEISPEKHKKCVCSMKGSVQREKNGAGEEERRRVGSGEGGRKRRQEQREKDKRKKEENKEVTCSRRQCNINRGPKVQIFKHSVQWEQILNSHCGTKETTQLPIHSNLGKKKNLISDFKSRQILFQSIKRIWRVTESEFEKSWRKGKMSEILGNLFYFCNVLGGGGRKRP